MTDWASWKKTVDYVVATQGRWYGIGNGDGVPIFTLPAPLSSDTPEQWMESPDLEISFPALTPEGQPNRLAETFILDALDKFDPSGQLPVAPGEYMLLVAFPGKDGQVERRGGAITHADADDPENDGLPNSITLHALNAMDVWNTIPAVSWPSAWWAATPYERTTDESKIPYRRPHHMARVELATRTTFTWKHGQAGFVIRRLAQESLDAAMMTQSDPDGTRWVDDPYHVVEVPEKDTTPEISLEARDGFLWETVLAQAKNAGVILGAYIWWPGDKPVRCWSQARSTMSPREVDISPSKGESHRTVGEREFPHAMIVLTVKEVS